jgi:nickel-dependent lactate racemase
MLIQNIAENGFLNEDEIRATVTEACASMEVDNKRVLFIIPDSTRSMPLPLLFRALFDALHQRVAKMDYLIALGTHPPMPESAINHMQTWASSTTPGAIPMPSRPSAA